MKILITGGCGFLGTNLANEAFTRGFQVAIFDNLSRVGAASNLAWLQSKRNFTFFQSDIRNDRDVLDAIETFKPTVIFHAAGQVAMTTSIANPRLDFEVNAWGTINLLEAVRKITPKTMVIYSSTNKVYGDLRTFTFDENETRYTCREAPNGFNEQTPLDFHSPYGCSKGSADQYMLDYHRIFGLKTVVFRHSSMYGGRQFATEDQGWIGWFCNEALRVKNTKNAKPISIAGSGKQVRDVLHAKDMVELYFSSIENIDKISGEAFNIGGGQKSSISLLELLKFLETHLKINIEIQKNLPRESDQLVFVANTEKAHRLIGWEPKVPLKVGLNEMMQWVSDSN